MRRVRIGLIDFGTSVDLDAVTTLAGIAPQRVRLLAGSPDARFGPFGAPLQVVLADGDDRVTLRLHEPGVLVVRRERHSDGGWPVDLAHWRERIRLEVADAVRDPYKVEPAQEAWEVRIGALDEAAARDFVLADGAKTADLERMEREGQGIILGRDRAVVWGDEEGIEETLDVLELARAILVEFRTYDAYLDRRLESSFRTLDRLWAAGGLFRSARAALRDLSQVRVEVARLTDPLHGTGKAFGDRFAERLHEKVQQRLRVDAWEHAVAHKTGVLEDMFHLAQEEANHRRALVLEAMIVLLFILDLYLLFKIE